MYTKAKLIYIYLFLAIIPYTFAQTLSSQGCTKYIRNITLIDAKNKLTVSNFTFALPSSHFPKEDSCQINSKRLRTIMISGSALYVTTMTGLYSLWYKNNPQTGFHFFNDNQEWNQVDKTGHFYTAYHFSRTSTEAFKWTGMSPKKAMFWGAMSGIIMMTPIEILDGFSAEYGASWGDLIANTSGSILMYGQYTLWNEIRIHPKFSFHPTGFAPQRPNTLGKSFQEEILKDYNGQTYWLSFDIDKFLPPRSFPKWLNIAIGYGAHDMLYANPHENRELAGLQTYPQFYLGLDWDLTAIPTKSKFMKTLFYLGNMIRLPAPAIEYSTRKRLKFHPFYF